MRICIYGAGAIGGLYAVKLATAGHDVSVITRGDHLKAIRGRGLTLRAGGEDTTVRLKASDRAADLGLQDAIIATVKATSLHGLPGDVAPLLHEHTTIIFAQNGIPWWYNIYRPAGGPPTPDLSWLDPSGALHALAPRTIGGVVFTAAEVIEPGVVRHNSLNPGRLAIGELDDRASTRIATLRHAFTEAGIESLPPPSIRYAVWTKLMGNMTGSVMAALIGKSTRDEQVSQFVGEVMERIRAEARSIAAAYGVAFEPPKGGRRGAPGHTASILQDLRRSRPMEVDGLIVAPLLFARAAGLDTPALDVMGALVAYKAFEAGLYTPARPFPARPVSQETAA